jgi:hypothetical protein
MDQEIFHLAHLIPDPRLHIFHGYTEVIDSLEWGLRALGHQVTRGINKLSHQDTNIIFGAQMLEAEVLARLPEKTIIYNLEQHAGAQPQEIRPSIRYCAQHFEVWDYSATNLPIWRALNSRGRFQHVPVGYAPTLSRIERPPNQDIDVLFYGGPSEARLAVFAALCRRLAKAVFVHGLYGAARDDLIGRSKLVLNINQYPQHYVFEIARVSYLLANRKAVVSDISENSRIEEDLGKALCFVPQEGMVDACMQLLSDSSMREGYEQAGFDAFSRRDIRIYLDRVLAVRKERSASGP